MCIGCKNKYPKSPKPPQDICIENEEWREFTVANTSKQQLKFGIITAERSAFGCIVQTFHMVPPEMSLSLVHKQLLLSVFGLVV